MARLRFGTLLAAGAIIVAACGGSPATSAPGSQAPATSTEPGTSTAPSDSAAAGQPKDGGTLIVAIPGDIKRTDPALIDDSNTSYVMQNVMEGLVKLKAGTTGELEPALAEKWDVSADGLTYTFKIRQGVKFHDGTTLDAAAVKYNYDRWLNLPKELQDYSYYLGAVFGGYADGSNIATTDAPDASTFVLTLKSPVSSFLLAQTLTPFAISSPTALQAGKADNTVKDVTQIPYAQGGTDAMVGTGPYKFKSWTVGDNVTIEKNPDYWDTANAGHVDQIVFKAVAEEAQRLNGLSTGEIDLAQTVAPIDIQTIQADSNLQVIDRGASCNLFHLGMNQTYPIFQNEKIREAVAYAINKQALIDAFYAGQGVPADNWMPPGTQYYKAEALPTYDPEKAKALIAESGVKDLTIDLWYPSDVTRPYMPDPKGIFEAISRDLEAVGFTVKPNTATWNPDYLDAEYAGKYPAWLIGWTCDWAGPDNFLKTAFFGYVDGKPSTEFAYKNDDLNKTMADALAATDEATAQSLWEKAQDLIRADIPTVPLVSSTPPAAARADVKGFVGSGALNEYLNTVWLDR
jgi:peptide/nickel transport system substrate-binding protein